MDSLHKVVVDCRHRTSSDTSFIEQIAELFGEHGPAVYQVVFHILAGLELSPEKSQQYWKELLEHRSWMRSELARDIDLVPALYDFLALSSTPLAKPRLIEEQAYSRVIQETTHDGLTTLFNRHYFDEMLKKSLMAAERYYTDISLLFLDIDDFKDINDNYGHAFGDTVLQQVAQIIKNEGRESDISARYGGEEFVVLMPHTECMNAYHLAERIRLKIEQHFMQETNDGIPVTISGGLASYPQHSAGGAELLQRADSALYLAKGSGKNCISMYKQEKRRYLRVAHKEQVKIKELGFQSSPTFAGTSKDLCIGGILFENSSPLPIGSRIQVSLPINDDKPVLLIGTVVRIQSFADDKFDIGMTIAFRELEKNASTQIAHYLQNHGS